MNENEKKVLRMNLLGGMHSYMMNCIGNEDIQDTWLQFGVPDEPAEEDLESIAEDNQEFAEIVHLFGKLVFEELDPFEDAIS